MQLASGIKCSADVSRNSASYYKLPQQQQFLKLCVLKLDGNCFDVQVANTASVADLKQAVEDVFNRSPKEGQGKISWVHVWGHFCLCYQDYKLINDNECLRNFGIKDGDQLNFLRHLSMYHFPVDRPKKHATVRGQGMSLPGPDDKAQIEDDEDHGNHRNKNDIINQNEFQLAHFLRGWLSYWRLWFMGRMRSEGKRYQRIAGNNPRRGDRAEMRSRRF